LGDFYEPMEAMLRILDETEYLTGDGNEKDFPSRPE
jgi:hypothetical protein